MEAKYNSNSLKCVVCGKTERIMKRCSKCQETFYCSRNCQKLDWVKHQRMCSVPNNHELGELGCSLVGSQGIKSDELVSLKKQDTENKSSEVQKINKQTNECQSASKEFAVTNDLDISQEHQRSFYAQDQGDTCSIQDGIRDTCSMQDGIGDTCSMQDGIGDTCTIQDGIRDTCSMQDGIRDTCTIQDGIGDTCSIQDGIRDTCSMQDGIGDTCTIHDGIGDTCSIQDGIRDTSTIQDGVRDTCIQDGIRDTSTIQDGIRDTCTSSVEDRIGDTSTIQDGIRDTCIQDGIKDTSTVQDGIMHAVLVYVRYAKSKHKVELTMPCAGMHVFQAFSRVTKVPVRDLKLIHKGKLQTEMNIVKNVTENAIFLAFGQMAEDEEGLDAGDIELIMKQLSVDRNVAVKALRKTNCLLDAMFDIGNS